MTDSQTHSEKPPTFEEALDELETLVEEIEEGKVSLEESIQRYGRGMELIKTCRAILDQAEQNIHLLAESEDGELTPGSELPAPEAGNGDDGTP